MQDGKHLSCKTGGAEALSEVRRPTVRGSHSGHLCQLHNDGSQVVWRGSCSLPHKLICSRASRRGPAQALPHYPDAGVTGHAIPDACSEQIHLITATAAGRVHGSLHK